MRIRRFIVIIMALILILPLVDVDAQGDTPKAPPSDVELPLGELVYTADFSTWVAGTAPGFLDYSSNEDGLTLLSTDPESGLGMVPPQFLEGSDFYSEFSFTLNECAASTSALLFSVRLDPNSQDFIGGDQYVFVLQCDGSYRSRPITNGAPGNIDIRGAIESELELDSSHVFGVMLQGDQVNWYLDGQTVGSYIGSLDKNEGAISFGGQLGVGYTIHEWRVWKLAASDTGSDNGTTNAGDDPVANAELGDALYTPDFTPPTSITYGLHLPVARYVNSTGIGMYNNAETGILELSSVNQSDYYFEVQFVIRSCAEDAVIGLVWRSSVDLSSFYVFAVQCDGDYRARAVVNGEVGDILVEDTIGQELNYGQLNSMSVYVRGDMAWLYFNQKLLTSMPGDQLADGITGILLQSSTAGAKMDVIVTDISILAVE